MCGFVGFVGNKPPDLSLIKTMTGSLDHRGPDSSNVWLCKNDNIALGHTRLAILDISDNGSQPMESHSGRYIITFNGEIYNHHELRKRLEQVKEKVWRGDSDTETIIELIELYGLKETLMIVKGMFAFAVWDKKDKELFLARDIAGEKPLYYGFQNNILIFGSELKALKLHSEFDNKIDNKAISMFMKYSYIPEPLSIYEKTKKLPPGCYIKLKYKSLNDNIKVNKYWDLSENINNESDNYLNLNTSRIINAYEDKLLSSISLQQISDRPIGAFLSGGVDSSLVVALMQSINNSKVKTFTIGNLDKRYDESENAREISKHLKTDHHELLVGSHDVLNVIPKLQKIYDEPFADSSQIPSYLVSSLAKDHVNVCLSGDGGDELFGGYNRYVWSRRFNKTPRISKKILSILLNKISSKNLATIYNLIEEFLPNSYRFKLPEEKFQKIKFFIESVDGLELYKNLVGTPYLDKSILLQDDSYDNLGDKWNNLKHIANDTTLMMALDFQTYLGDDILCKNDRASMYHSLEVRTPFLDKDVVKFAFNISDKLKINNGESKWISKQLLKRYLPLEKLSSAKTGFSVPIDNWLKKDLRSWSEDLLCKNKIDKFEILDSSKITNLWDDHKSGKVNNSKQIWNIVMLQSWLEENV